MSAQSYLAHLCRWGLPVLALQLAALVVRFRRRSLDVLRAVAVPALIAALWLTFADGLAIDRGLWRFGESHLLGIGVGPVPIEELAFFCLADLLVACGLALAVPRTWFGRRASRPPRVVGGEGGPHVVRRS